MCVCVCVCAYILVFAQHIILRAKCFKIISTNKLLESIII